MVPMLPTQVFETLGADVAEAEALYVRLRPDTPADWRALAAGLAVSEAGGDCRVLGISGGQGAGKSTLSMLLEQAFRLQGIRLLVLSLDDFYLSRAERQLLAEREHPLLATRGVPGTHDIERLTDTLAAVFESGVHHLPVFDKGTDDRAPEPRWFDGPADMVVLEGWCVGVRAQPSDAVQTAVNDLERQQDAEGRWRRFVNAALAGGYARLWQRIDQLLYLAVPDLEAVIRWRAQQEQARPEEQRMSSAQIRDFVAHYERLTRWMGQTLVDEANIVAFLDANHALAALKRRAARSSDA